MVVLKRVGNGYLVLSPEEKDALNAVLANPSCDTWEDARSVVLARLPDPLTLEDAVRAVSLFGWRESPDGFTLRRALRFAARLV